MIIFISIIFILSLTVFFYMQQAKFGKSPADERLTLMEQASNYKDGRFLNRSATPLFADGHNALDVWRDMLFVKHPRLRPTDTIPSIKNDLLRLPADTDMLVWFGHSSYFMQVGGKTFLVDPVFSGNASPLPGSVKAFTGTDIYAVSDLPDIDYLLITHDHYDHLDYETILVLKDRTRKVICGLGVGAHFEYWGYPKEHIIEKNWNEKIILDSTSVIYTEEARHQSGRSLSRNNTLWMSYVLQTSDITIFMGDDGGYDTHFAEIGNRYGTIDLAILENGQYNKAWHYIHCLPEETLKAAQDLHAKRILPVHNSKFTLAKHPWDEPLNELIRLNKSYNIPLLTPMIGEIVYLKDTNQKFKQWWVEIN